MPNPSIADVVTLINTLTKSVNDDKQANATLAVQNTQAIALLQQQLTLAQAQIPTAAQIQAILDSLGNLITLVNSSPKP